ncbi:MAG: AIR synthase-related protein, partial [archaeon GB-1867-035]|nr:AIR synthase-related protein [Candidatus Culexmicrobium profundum]
HNTGGGLTKILRIGVNLRYIKDNLPPIDPIFKLIQLEGKVNWSEMYEVFNMGIGFEIIVKEEYVDEVVSISEKYGVDAYVIGRVERSSFQSNEVIIKTPEGTFTYRGK